MKHVILIILIFSMIVVAPLRMAYPKTEYGNIRFMDINGDLADEIIMKSKHSAGTGHYIEDMRIFKDKYPGLELIFSVRTLDSYFGFEHTNNYDVVSEVQFTEANINDGTRSIIIKSRKIYYKDGENKVIDKQEDLGTEIFKWDGKSFIREKH